MLGDHPRGRADDAPVSEYGRGLRVDDRPGDTGHRERGEFGGEDGAADGGVDVEHGGSAR